MTNAPEDIGTLPIITLHHSLEEETDIKSLVIGIQVKTEMVTGSIVAYHLQITMILQSLRTFGDTRFSILISIHNVTCSPDGTKRVLSAYLIQMCLHFGICLGNSYGFKTPDFTYLTTCNISID